MGLAIAILVTGSLFSSLGSFAHHLSVKPEIDLAGAAAAAIAAAALLVAWRQLGSLDRQTRATALLSLDSRWDEGEFFDHRTALQQFIQGVERLVRQHDQGLSPEERLALKRSISNDELWKLNASDYDRYRELFKVLGFMETMAYSARRGYLDTDDVLQLFGGTVDVLGIAFELHIKKLHEIRGSTAALEHFLWLLGKQRRQTRRTRLRHWIHQRALAVRTRLG